MNAMTRSRSGLPLTVGALIGLAMSCGGSTTTTDAGTTLHGSFAVINELAGTGGDFVELYNPGDVAFDLAGHGLTDWDADGGVRYSTALRFVAGAQIPPKGWFTISLEADCPANITPCVRGEFGLSQSTGDTVTLLDANNATLAQQQ
jgi:hypothetical protein